MTNAGCRRWGRIMAQSGMHDSVGMAHSSVVSAAHGSSAAQSGAGARGRAPSNARGDE
jgi:hypothetical protein